MQSPKAWLRFEFRFGVCVLKTQVRILGSDSASVLAFAFSKSLAPFLVLFLRFTFENQSPKAWLRFRSRFCVCVFQNQVSDSSFRFRSRFCVWWFPILHSVFGFVFAFAFFLQESSNLESVLRSVLTIQFCEMGRFRRILVKFLAVLENFVDICDVCFL